VLAFDEEGKARGQADAEATPVAHFDADIRAALEYLKAHPEVAAGKIGVAGHCTGGRLAFRAMHLLGDVTDLDEHTHTRLQHIMRFA